MQATVSAFDEGAFHVQRGRDSTLSFPLEVNLYRRTLTLTVKDVAI